jgi:hypothetical protein
MFEGETFIGPCMVGNCEKEDTHWHSLQWLIDNSATKEDEVWSASDLDLEEYEKWWIEQEEKRELTATGTTTDSRTTTKTTDYGWYDCGEVHASDKITLSNNVVIEVTACWDKFKRPGSAPDVGVYFDTSWPQHGDLQSTYLAWPDGGIPYASFEFVRATATYTMALAEAGYRVEIGCLGAHGRTGTFLAILDMVALGSDHEKIDPEALINWVKSTHCHKAIETEVQRWYIKAMAAHIKGEPIPDKPAPPSYTVTTTTTTPAKKYGVKRAHPQEDTKWGREFIGACGYGRCKDKKTHWHSDKYLEARGWKPYTTGKTVTETTIKAQRLPEDEGIADNDVQWFDPPCGIGGCIHNYRHWHHWWWISANGGSTTDNYIDRDAPYSYRCDSSICPDFQSQQRGNTKNLEHYHKNYNGTVVAVWTGRADPNQRSTDDTGGWVPLDDGSGDWIHPATGEVWSPDEANESLYEYLRDFTDEDLDDWAYVKGAGWVRKDSQEYEDYVIANGDPEYEQPTLYDERKYHA